MPDFTADRMLYQADDQFGAETSYYVLTVAAPNPQHTIPAQKWPAPPPPNPVKDMTLPVSWPRETRFYPDYRETILSDLVATWFQAQVGDWILLSLRDANNPLGIVHERGCYCQIDKILVPGDPGYRPLLFRVSADALRHEFDYHATVHQQGPATIPLHVRPQGAPCYDCATKLDI